VQWLVVLFIKKLITYCEPEYNICLIYRSGKFSQFGCCYIAHAYTKHYIKYSIDYYIKPDIVVYLPHHEMPENIKNLCINPIFDIINISINNKKPIGCLCGFGYISGFSGFVKTK
jgi:hypothetical protein